LVALPALIDVSVFTWVWMSSRALHTWLEAASCADEDACVAVAVAVGVAEDPSSEDEPHPLNASAADKHTIKLLSGFIGVSWLGGDPR
jgi:hypothetical protein